MRIKKNVVVDLNKMHNYRILSVGTMRQWSLAQGDLATLCRERNDPELEAIMWRLSRIGCTIDWADKFLCINSKPISNTTKALENHNQLCRELLPQISHRPQSLQGVRDLLN